MFEWLPWVGLEPLHITQASATKTAATRPAVVTPVVSSLLEPVEDSRRALPCRPPLAPSGMAPPLLDPFHSPNPHADLVPIRESSGSTVPHFLLTFYSLQRGFHTYGGKRAHRLALDVLESVSILAQGINVNPFRPCGQVINQSMAFEWVVPSDAECLVGG